MKIHRLALLLTALSASFVRESIARADQDEQAAGQRIEIAVGENRMISAEGVRNYSEGVKGVVDVKLTTDKTKFVIAGQKPGSTTLLLIKNDGSQETLFISVYQRSMDSVQREVEELLEGTNGVRVRRVGHKIFVDGGVATENEQKRVTQIAALYPGQVESLVVTGATPADSRIDIRIDFFFVKYNQARTWAVGIDWPGRYGGGTTGLNYDILTRNVTSANASIMGQPLPALDLAASKGWAKVLKQSTVISRNGNEATFESGGQENFPVTSAFTSTIQSIDFGTNVTVTPRYDTQRRDLSIKLTATVSDLEAPVSSTLPSKSTSKLVTIVDLKLGQALVLSGFRTRSQRHSIHGIPVLSEIPLLGALFGSHKDSSEEADGAIFVVPTVIESVSPSTLDMVTDAITRYESFSGDVEDVRAYEHRPRLAPKPRNGNGVK
jgi:pilus assembly protein CpaC